MGKIIGVDLISMAMTTQQVKFYSDNICRIICIGAYSKSVAQPLWVSWVSGHLKH